MFSTFKKGAAAVAALALAGVGMAATAAPASAALATTPPAYVGNTAVDPNSNGNFLLYDANGNRIVGGSLTNLGGAIYFLARLLVRVRSRRTCRSLLLITRRLPHCGHRRPCPVQRTSLLLARSRTCRVLLVRLLR